MTTLEISISVSLGITTIGVIVAVVKYLEYKDTSKLQEKWLEADGNRILRLSALLTEAENKLRKEKSQPYIVPEDHKVCSHCSTSLPLTDFYFQEEGEKGVRSQCKKCMGELQKARYLAKKGTEV